LQSYIFIAFFKIMVLLDEAL